jgi:hypothetical protein
MFIETGRYVLVTRMVSVHEQVIMAMGREWRAVNLLQCGAETFCTIVICSRLRSVFDGTSRCYRRNIRPRNHVAFATDPLKVTEFQDFPFLTLSITIASLQDENCFVCVLRIKQVIVIISGFRRYVDVICALLGCYAASSGNQLPTFRDNVSFPSSRVKKCKKKSWTS